MRSFLISSACAASLVLALTSAASAADVDYRPEPAGPSWYVSIFGGWSLPDNLDVDLVGLSSTELSGSIDLDNGFMAGIAVNSTGHAHPKVVQAIKDASEKFLHICGTDFYYEGMAALCERH